MYSDWSNLEWFRCSIDQVDSYSPDALLTTIELYLPQRRFYSRTREIVIQNDSVRVWSVNMVKKVRDLPRWHCG